MATATRQRPPARKRPPARHLKKGAPTAAARSARNKAKREASRRRRARVDVVRRGLGRGDLWGAVLVVAGVLVALGTWADVGGPAGRAVDEGLDSLAGVARFALPLAQVWVGALLIRGRSGDATSRVAAGLALALVAGNGLFHLLEDGLGGGLGRGVATPLKALLSPWGAGVVLVALVGAAVLVVTATTVRTAADHLATAGRWFADATRPAVDGLRRGVHWLTTVSHAPAGSDAAGVPATAIDTRPPPVLFDAAVDDPPLAEATVAHATTPHDLDPTQPGLRTHPPVVRPPDDAEQLAIDLGPAAERGPWKLPPLSLLARTPAQEIDRRLVEQAGRTLEHALAAHGVETRLVGMAVGPTVTRYELELGPGVKVARVTSLHRDIAYAMASPDVRILAPIPGRSAIGVEVPNQQRQLVAVGDILASEEAHRALHACEVAVGRDISGRAVLANLADMPHLLIAGATGAGKSSCINSVLTSILVRSTPDQVRLILVDPKRVELGQYGGVPHLLAPVVVDPKKAANALAWAVREMERRYDLLSEVGVRDITGYNAAFDRGELRRDPRVEGVDDPGETLHTRLPFIIVVVDELNDLMMVAARDVEESICRIAQKARAVGIHLVIATQRPSVNVITGVIKANIPARLAFAVSSLADSRVILDQAGAERLVGQGDMLLLGATSSSARRIQGAWVGEDEVHKVVAHWRRQSPSVVSTVGLEDDHPAGGTVGEAGAEDDDDELCRQAMDLVVRSQLGSTSMLQRKLRVGFARAGRLMDLLEQRGVVGPSTGSKARDVLMTPAELDDLQGGDDR
ncbi:MAG: DNA translocase FtsK [Actinobacteria bacterium]|nr:DNA translocase FtsK [Actinomycetota bacterium]